MINRVSPQEMARRHQAWADTHGLNDPPPSPRNVRPVVWLSDPFRIPFRGHLWEIPPVPFEDGARCLELMDWFQKSAEDPTHAVEEYRDRMRDAVALIRRLVRPHKGRLRRLRWRLRLMRNPWRTASHEELGEILGFFWGRRTKSLDRRPWLLGQNAEA